MPQLLVPPASGCSARLSRNDRATVTVTPCSESDGGLGPEPAGTETAAPGPILVSGSSSCCAAGSAILSGGVSASHEYRRPSPQTSGPSGRRRRAGVTLPATRECRGLRSDAGSIPLTVTGAVSQSG